MKKCILLFSILSVFTQVKAQNETDKFELKTTLISPEKITKINEGHYFIDFGRDFFGTVGVTSKREQNDSIIFRLGEKLETTNKIDRNPGGTIRYQQVKVNSLSANQSISLQLTPDKRNTGSAAIVMPAEIGVIMPFRYLEVENLKVPIDEVAFVQKAVHYQFNDDASYFSSSNKIMDSIWDMCKHTIKATSFTGFYVDGDRERIPYEADAYINQLSHYSVDNDYGMARRTNAYFMSNPTWPTEWLLHTVLMFHTDYMYTGDIGPLEEHYENLKLKTLMDLERADGLISSHSSNLDEELILKLGFKKANVKIKDIIDWPGAQKDTGWKLAMPEGERDGYDIVPVNTVVNAFYYYNLKLMVDIANAIGKKEDAIFFKDKAEKVMETINSKLFNHEKGYYLDGENTTHSSLHANMFPLAFDLVPQEHVKTVTDFVKTRGMACSVYGAQYLLEGLYKNNEEKYAAAMISDTIGDRNWWNMIKIGSTMTMEAWDMKYKPNSDWNHAWGTAPLNVITRYMWGIQPKTAGFKTAMIKPLLGDLESSSIKVPTILGPITADYVAAANNKKQYTISIPEHMTADFEIGQAKKIYLNGKKVSKKKEIIQLQPGKNVIEITSSK
ncbi:family 78 glycoside hydrolase catalytic domain [Flavobacterium algicola]|uniref:family 78 glycoside hydrolase catalytic domain n=1 Tax=Flavobacterium algicola TaxID=556529 RepID=UPI001EFD1323|nr:family 78 glycoside hydrolase catalytic domain [Flavobacterium algicola]MCG9793159.1 family 78 glycoside hydrolase catalytic domain [Flavobacterium algicola]